MMQAIEAIPALNRILGILSRSLPTYLADAKPWRAMNGSDVYSAIQRLAADQHRYARRVADAIVRLGGQPTQSHFPSAFAAKNDLSVDFLLRDVLEWQEQDIDLIARCAAELDGMSSLHALAEEVLGNAKGHRDILRQLAKRE
ncbi:MAG: hypothetical protein ABFC96_02045 [Thermoguttaceae bacterium]